MAFDPITASAAEIAARGARGRDQRAARSSTRACRHHARAIRSLNAFTAVTAERARATRGGDRRRARARRRTLGPLAGVPFAVKNLFDVAGLPTLAGSKINRERPPATRDATLIERLEAAGAVLVGALNMGEYAYDFTGENVHDGPSRNPHDIARMTGGSSGGSGGAVAGGLVPLSLGSDTNGSIRVPASLCGIFGLKPTYGRLSRARTFPVRRKPRSSRAARALGRRPRARLRRDAGATTRTIRSAPTRPAEPALPLHRARHRRPAHRGRGRLFPQGCGARGADGARARRGGARRQARDRNSRSRARARRRLRHHRDRRRGAASRPAAHARARFRSRRCATG